MTRSPAKGAAYETLVANRPLIALDIETTTVPDGDGHDDTLPVSVGAVLMLNGTRRETFHTLIDPGVEVDEASSAYNGITTADLAGAPDTATALADLDAFLSARPDAILVCHNARFDITHLHTAYRRAGMTPFTRTVLDTQFLPVRLHLDGASSRSKLANLVRDYGVTTTLTGIPPRQRRLHKALQDAQDTAEVLSCLLAEAAAAGSTDFDELLTVAKAASSIEVAGAGSHPRRHQAPKPVSASHIRSAHRSRGLTRRPSRAALNKWTAELGECVTEHCPLAVEKITIEADQPDLLDQVTSLLAACPDPGDMGTLLGAIEPLLTRLDRPGARAFHRTNHQAIKSAPACDDAQPCPHCASGHPCPQDTTVHLLTRRALDYGTTSKGDPVSLFSRRVKDDLWDEGHDRKMDTWPAQGMHDMAAHMMWLLIEEAHRKHLTTRRLDIINKAVTRGLHEHDPRLALEIARHWTTQPSKDADIAQLVQVMRDKATTDPGFIELDMWFDGPHQRTRAARAAAAQRKARPAAKGVRRPAPVELRPPEVKHTFRYQLHRADAGQSVTSREQEA